MANIPVSYVKADVRGTAAFEALDTAIDTNLLSGAEPGVQPSTRILMADSLSLAQFTVVGLDANNHLVKATYNATPASAIKPIGVLAHAAVSGASNSTVYGEVFLTGCYNAGNDDAGSDSPLVWDVSFDTLAKKLAAVVGNPNLLFRSRKATGSPAA